MSASTEWPRLSGGPAPFQINSWRAAPIEEVRRELESALAIQLSPESGEVFSCVLPVGVVRLAASPAATAAVSIFTLGTRPSGEEEEHDDEGVGEALAAHLRAAGLDWYVPHRFEAAAQRDELGGALFDIEMIADLLRPRWLAWVSAEERDDAKLLLYDLNSLWFMGTSFAPAGQRGEDLMRRWRELDARWPTLAPGARRSALAAYMASERIAVFRQGVADIEAWLQTGRAARGDDLKELARWRDELEPNPDHAARDLIATIDELVAGISATPSVMIIAVRAASREAFESLSSEERRYESRGWTNYPVRSARRLDTFLQAATHVDLGAAVCEDRPGESEENVECSVIDEPTLADVLPAIEALIEPDAEATAAALCAHAGGGEVAPVAAALRTGAWPRNGDAAEEAAAFAFHLRSYARKAKEAGIGVCWEVRGPIEPRPPITPSVTLILVRTEGHDEFEAMSLDERRRTGGGWVTFPLRSRRRLCTFAMKATHSDFAVLHCRDEIGRHGERVDTNLIGHTDVDVLTDLEETFQTHAERAVAQLVAHGDASRSATAVAWALRTGTWPADGDPAEEAAAFVHHLMRSLRDASAKGLAVCWEYRGLDGL